MSEKGPTLRYRKRTVARISAAETPVLEMGRNLKNNDSREIIPAIGACSTSNGNFLKLSTATPLANECSIEVSVLEAELTVAHNLAGLQHIKTTEEF